MDRKRNPSLLTDDQLALLQEFINTAGSGQYDAMDLIPAEYREYFSVPQVHRQQFYAAVKAGHLKHISFLTMDRHSKHLRYRVM